MVYDPTERPTVAWCAKRGVAYGAALGMLAGLIYLAVLRADEVTEITIWRNCILGGAVVGVAAGLLIGVWINRDNSADSDQ